MSRFLITAVLGFILIGICVNRAESGVNNESGRASIWSSVKESSDRSRKESVDDSLSVFNNNQEDLDGGFSSLDGMLQWAIGHSDPTKLQETAKDVQSLSSSELNKRQMEIKDLVEELKMPSDAQLMQTAIRDLNNSSLSLEDHHRALQELLILVEPIDNANDLHKLGGLAVIIGELGHADPESRKISAWILGTASQNNPVVQKQVLELGGLPKLMMMVKSSSREEAIKALFAVSALIRNNLAGQELFFKGAGELVLQEILSNSSADIRLRIKAMVLVADIAEFQIESGKESELHPFNNHFLLKSVVDLTATPDLNLHEKVLQAIKNLLQLRSVDVSIFKEFCRLDMALEGLRQQLQKMLEQNDRDFVLEVENLRKEVELIYLSRLDNVRQQQVMQVPT
ncbi:uncharacterized protein LOC108196822 [Daucus carota subsp. sativus]|uniref:uncharacterized protein LOC108196822 n=1 Tax=Daucus carota subsp. sativus TaxID=79200 RepID=UPI0007F03071|nr:PREDICTED: nucleotide exchange factor SIL1 [Daucus carota subsp. sativus]